LHPVALGVTGERGNGYKKGYTDRYNKKGPLPPVPPKNQPSRRAWGGICLLQIFY